MSRIPPLAALAPVAGLGGVGLQGGVRHGHDTAAHGNGAAEAVAALAARLTDVAVLSDAPIRASARNRLPGTIVSLDDGAVNSEVALELADGKTLTATITRGSVDNLGLKVGDRATALVKASHVILAVE